MKIYLTKKETLTKISLNEIFVIPKKKNLIYALIYKLATSSVVKLAKFMSLTKYIVALYQSY